MSDTVQILIAIIILCVGFIVGGIMATNVKRKEHIKEVDEIISSSEEAYNKIKKERDEYKEARDKVFKQVTDLLNEREQTKKANK